MSISASLNRGWYPQNSKQPISFWQTRLANKIKYLELATYLSRSTHSKNIIDTITKGFLGSWDLGNDMALKRLAFTKRMNTKITSNLTGLAVTESYYMLLNHTNGSLTIPDISIFICFVCSPSIIISFILLLLYWSRAGLVFTSQNTQYYSKII